MRFSAAIALAAAAPALVSAADHTVNVGNNGTLSFDPPNFTADLGDSITFVFQSKNHSVVQSTFADPCTKSNINGTAGFASGFMPVQGDGTQMPSFAINVSQSGPIWFYCSQAIPLNHCHMGMVGAVNAPPDKTYDAFKAAAIALNSSSTNGTSTNGTASGGAPSATPTGGAMRLSGSAAGLLTLAGLVAGLSL